MASSENIQLRDALDGISKGHFSEFCFRLDKIRTVLGCTKTTEHLSSVLSSARPLASGMHMNHLVHDFEPAIIRLASEFAELPRVAVCTGMVGRRFSVWLQCPDSSHNHE